MNNNVATAAGGDSSERQPIPVFLQTKEDATTQHVATILNVVHVMRSMLIIPEEETAARLSGETRIAAQSTLIHACARLDAILNEPERWSISGLTRLHEAIIKVHQTQEKVLRANLAYIEMNQRPSYHFKPQLATYNSTHFIAFWGKIEEPGMAIIGRGRTPAEALKDFDAAFHRTPKEQYNLITRAMEEETSPQPPTETNPPPTDNNLPSDDSKL